MMRVAWTLAAVLLVALTWLSTPTTRVVLARGLRDAAAALRRRWAGVRAAPSAGDEAFERAIACTLERIDHMAGCAACAHDAASCPVACAIAERAEAWRRRAGDAEPPRATDARMREGDRRG